ncbi:MAG TPA: glycosyltransferase [Cyclobacteriaceae bacterium]|nr:glycosyltransferase [Cyclobacteriaceae bacterium]
MLPKFSIIIPVYNRPQEVDELLSSLVAQTVKSFEVIIVEDGSSIRCDDVVDRYRDLLTIQYFFKPNSGPGPSRNFGYQHAQSEYFVVFDSDCIIPPTYLEAVEKSLQQNHWDAWGGPDKAHENFTPIQRAMGYTMASVLTTGGIRGGKKHVGWFQPRSFNMGISRRVFEATSGFKFDRFAEDIEFSIRMKKGGFNVGLIPEAYVYHKRRTNFRQFHNQVYNFGKGRALVGRSHPEEIKLTHWFPTIFSLGFLSVPVVGLFSSTLFSIGASMFTLYFAAIFIHSLSVNKSLLVAILSVPSAFLQLWGYGTGFLLERMKSYTT